MLGVGSSNAIIQSHYSCIHILAANLVLKDGASYFFYCAYVLRISRYSDFLSPMLSNTGIYLHSLKLSGEGRS